MTKTLLVCVFVVCGIETLYGQNVNNTSDDVATTILVETSDDMQKALAALPLAEDVAWKLVSMVEEQSPTVLSAFSPDSGAFVTVSAAGDVSVIRVSDGSLIGKFKPEETVQSIALAPDHRHVAIGDEKAAVYESASGKRVYEHQDFLGDVTYLAISRDGKLLLGADKEGAVRRFPLLGGKGGSWLLNPKKQPFSAITAGPDLDRIAYTVPDGYSLYFRFPGLQNPKEAPENVDGIFDGATKFAIGNSNFLAETDGRFVFVRTSAIAGEFNLDLRSSELYEIQSMTVSHDDDRYLIATAEGQIGLYDGAYTDVRAIGGPPPGNLRPTVNPSISVLASDCRTMAIVQPTRTAFWRMTTDPLHRMREVHRLVDPLLEHEQFGLLTELCTHVFSAESPLITENELFSLITPGLNSQEKAILVSRLREWVAAYPDCSAPRIALADAFNQTAWQARGRGLAYTVNEDDAALFEENTRIALEMLLPVQPDTSTPDKYFELQLRLLINGGGSRDEFDQTIANVLKFCPQNITAHTLACTYLMPRWHGEPGDVSAYLDRVDESLGVDAGNTIQLAVILEQFPFYASDNFYEATGFDYKDLKLRIETQLKQEDLTTERQDDLLCVLCGLARRAEDLETIKSVIGRMEVSGWRVRNKHRRRAWLDALDSYEWLQSKEGPAAIIRALLDNQPLPDPDSFRNPGGPPLPKPDDLPKPPLVP